MILGEGIKTILSIGEKEKMINDMTLEEVEIVHILLNKGCAPDFITHAIVMGRGVGIHNDIRAQVDLIIEGKEEDEKR